MAGKKKKGTPQTSQKEYHQIPGTFKCYFIWEKVLCRHKLRISRYSSHITGGWGLNPSVHTMKHRWEGNDVTMKTEAGMICPQSNLCQGMLKATRDFKKQERIRPSSFHSVWGPVTHGFWLLAPITVRESISMVLTAVTENQYTHQK